MSANIYIGTSPHTVSSISVKVGTTGGPNNDGWRTVSSGSVYILASASWRNFFTMIKI